MPDKTLLYDWNGLNETIFTFINNIHGDSYDMVMVLISQMANTSNLRYYFCALLVWVAANFIVKKIRSKAGTSHYLTIWLAAFLVLGISFAADGIIVNALKEQLAYPRPYAALWPHEVHLLESKDFHDPDNFKSFPSGHASIITILVIGLWPVLSEGFRMIGVLMIPLVCWSRIAMGLHFPADVLGGFLIAMIITVIARMFVYRILRIFKLRC